MHVLATSMPAIEKRKNHKTPIRVDCAIFEVKFKLGFVEKAFFHNKFYVCLLPLLARPNIQPNNNYLGF